MSLFLWDTCWSVWGTMLWCLQRTLKWFKREKCVFVEKKRGKGENWSSCGKMLIIGGSRWSVMDSHCTLLTTFWGFEIFQNKNLGSIKEWETSIFKCWWKGSIRMRKIEKKSKRRGDYGARSWEEKTGWIQTEGLAASDREEGRVGIQKQVKYRVGEERLRKPPSNEC